MFQDGPDCFYLYRLHVKLTCSLAALAEVDFLCPIRELGEKVFWRINFGWLIPRALRRVEGGVAPMPASIAVRRAFSFVLRRATRLATMRPVCLVCQVHAHWIRTQVGRRLHVSFV